jgi:uncharacterized membrane protein YphA (DoxX/SURF4 family)
MSDPRVESPTSVEEYLSQLQRETAAGWDRFWFTPRDPVVLGLIRILTGLMLVYTHVVWGLQLERFLGPNSILQPGPLTNESGGAWATFWWYVPESSVTIVHWISVAVCVLFTLGVATRCTAILAWLITVSYANRLFFATFGLDQINAMLAFYLAISPCGDALSVDRWLRGRRQGTSLWVGQNSVGANIGIRLIQVNMCVIYLFAGLAKLEGASWWDGYAMWQAFANYEYQTIDLTWLAKHVFVWNILTHVTVVWEISFCTLVWVRLLRPMVLLIAIPLHVGIGAALGMWTFGLIMLVGCASFLSPVLVRKWLGLARPASAEAA